VGRKIIAKMATSGLDEDLLNWKGWLNM